MAEYSEIADDALYGVASDVEAASSHSEKQSAANQQPVIQPRSLGLRGISVSESPSEAAVYDMSPELIRIYGGNGRCTVDCSVSECPSKTAISDVSPDVIGMDDSETGCGDEPVGMSSFHEDDMDCVTCGNRNEAYVPVCRSRDILDDLAVLNPTGSINGVGCVENHPHVSNSGCSPNADTAVEQAVHDSVTSRVESAKLAGADGKSAVTDTGDLCGEKLTAECSADTAAANAFSGPDPDSFNWTENPAEECPATKPAEPAASDKKVPSLSFSPDVLLVAPTGKAANVLGRRTGVQAFTLHQVIFSYHAWRRIDFCPRPAWKFDEVRMLVVDECSLVAITTLHSLLSKVLPSLQKVVLLGDILQLPSIEPGAYLRLSFF